MDERLAQRLARIFAIQQVMITTLQASLEQAGFPKERMQNILQVAFQRSFEKQEQIFFQLLTASTEPSPDDEERDLWNRLGLGDLWKPSKPSDPEDPTSR